MPNDLTAPMAGMLLMHAASRLLVCRAVASTSAPSLAAAAAPAAACMPPSSLPHNASPVVP